MRWRFFGGYPVWLECERKLATLHKKLMRRNGCGYCIDCNPQDLIMPGKKQKKTMAKAVEKVVAAQFAGATASAKVGAPKKKKNAVKKAKRKAAGGVPMAAKASMRVDAVPAALGFELGQSYFNVKGMKSTTRRGEGVRIRGRDFFDTVQAGSVTPQGTAVANFPINPNSLPGTRLAQFCQLYEKYRFRKFRIIAVPNNPTSSSGMYGMSYDRDPTDATPDVSIQGVREYMAMPGTVLASSWKQCVMDCPLLEPVTDYYINAASGGGDERLVDQGQFYFWMPEDSPSGTTLKWVLIIDYDLELFIPQLGGNLAAVSFQSIAGTSALAFSPGSAAKAGWNRLQGVANLISQGSISELPLKLDSDGNAYVALAKGVYRVMQYFSAKNNSGSNKAFLWQAPQIVANAASDSKFLGTQSVSEWVDQWPIVADQQAGIATDVTTIRIPENGAKVYGNWGGTANFAVTAGTATFVLTILSMGEVFDSAFLAFGSASKFMVKMNERITQRHAEGERMRIPPPEKFPLEEPRSQPGRISSETVRRM